MEAPPKHHFLLFPWLALGHIIPFFRLAKRLADAGISVTYLSPPSVFPRLPPLQLPHHQSLITFHPLSLPSIPELPEAATTYDLLPHLQTPFKAAFDALQPLFHTLLPKLSPNLIIHDFTSYWLPQIATTVGIPTVFFSIFNAASMAYLIVPYRFTGKAFPPTAADLTSSPPDFPLSAIYFHPFEAKQQVGAHTFPEPDIPCAERLFRSISNSHMVIIRSCYELEKKYIDYIQENYQSYFKECRGGGDGDKKFLPIGFLPPRLGGEAQWSNDSGSCQKCMDWLDKQPIRSVTYVAFGTECRLNQAQTNAVAIGLEESGFRFLWVRRAPIDGVPEKLPDDFLERVQGRGLIVEDWVPQPNILSHPSIGVFFSHSGTSSVIEGLTTGKRLVLLPMIIDQGLIARLVADEWRAALEIERANLEDGSFTAESVCRAIQRAVSEEDDAKTWSNAKDLQARVFGNTELEKHYLSKFIDCATKLVYSKS